MRSAAQNVRAARVKATRAGEGDVGADHEESVVGLDEEVEE